MTITEIETQADVLTIGGKTKPMRANCSDLTEAVVPSGHWMAQERPVEVNAALAKWLATRFPGLWRI